MPNRGGDATHMKIQRSGAYGAAAAIVLLATLFLPVSTPNWYWIMAYCLVAALGGGALMFNARERRAGRPAGMGILALVILIILAAGMMILPAIWIW